MRHSFFIIIAVTFALSTWTCQNRKSAGQAIQPDITELKADPGEKMIFHRRTPCFGRCPSFQLTIYKSGYATYKGEQFVDNMGEFEGIVESMRIDSVFNKALEIGFWEMKESYDNKLVMDLPSISTELANADKKHSVLDRYKSPPELWEMYKIIDHLILATEWKATEATNDR